MIKTLIVIFLFFQSELNAEEYVGSIILSDSTIYTFELNLIINKENITGYSITNYGTSSETKSRIEGTFDKTKNEYIIIEKYIIYTKSKESIKKFCHLRIDLSEKGSFKSKRLEGEFIGYFDNKDKCAEGKIILIKKEKLKKIENKINKRIQKRINDKSEDNNKKLTLEKDDKFYIETSKKYISIRVWDPNQEDNDMITIKFNDDLILENYSTKNKPKKRRVKLSKGRNSLVISAINEGTNPPNTSTVEIKVDRQLYQIETNLEMKNDIIIFIDRK
ncbi:MAG: hypothetical protein CMP71_01220 [Flavobacteriales bacterium]|nr:hypothetical protein [Flavobacteriales bacterium]|tara:strand:- start:66349 stop:67176 length:828 start_codon:yes stop_codon:yes gene_type:complete